MAETQAETIKTAPLPSAPPTPAPAPKRIAAMPPNFLQPAENAHQRWAVVVGMDTPYENILRVEYWAHVAPKIRQGAIIEARAEDDSWYAEVYVRKVGVGGVSVREIRYHSFTDDDDLPDVPEQFKIEYRGSLKKHRVVRLSDQVEVGAGFETRADAERHARELARSYRL